MTIIRPPTKRIFLNLWELWEYIDLLYLFVWKDLKVRYKQTIVGASWAVLQPFMTMVVLSLFFGKLLNIPSQGIPYPVFVFTALVPWTYFTNILVQTSNSIVNNYDVITKAYFPRLLLPMAVIVTGLVDLAIALIILLGIMLFYGIVPTVAIWTLPFFIILTITTAFGIGLWLAALNVEYRDISYILPFITQIWFFITPVTYSSSLIPPQWKAIYGINPMAGVVEGFRWALLGKAEFSGILLLVSALVAVLLVVSGTYYFRFKEDSFADVV
ncbi:phosphate ABC transporter permease [Aphanothece hegewaldii CCALA 016]|uniref:Transport permease protein n=1 Tax=Aphanothece hegewaldii CCALA 016 TaxID=2107694 RepID=A0A2T1LWV1_9CHRO|nr:phosphate ABC transporter permease [Aphanothece hegewaldii CCALA 016]